MASVFPLLNVLLAFLGIVLLYITVFRSHQEKILRGLFVGYFVIVLQYNFDRLTQFPNYFLILGATLVLTAWFIRPAQAEQA